MTSDRRICEGMDDLRERVADPDAPTALVDDAAHEPHPLEVRLLAAKHHKLPYPTLVELLNDSEDRIRAVACTHHKMTGYLLDDMAGDPCEDVRCAVARHPHLRPRTADRLAADSSEKVREAVAAGYAISGSALRSLTKDVCDRVRQTAFNRDQFRFEGTNLAGSC